MLSNETTKKITNHLEDALNGILEENTQLNNLREIKTPVDWYRQTRQGKIEPGKILSMINNEMIQQFLKEFPTELSKSLEKGLTGIQIQSNNKHSGITLPLPAISPYVNAILDNNGIPLGSMTIAFRINTDVRLDGIGITSDEAKKHVAIDMSIFVITVHLITKMMLGSHMKKLAQKEFSINDIVAIL